MKEIVRYGFILALICIVAAGLLAGVNSVTKPRIFAQIQSELESGLKDVIPEAIRFEPVKSADEIIYYKAFDKNGKFLGAAFKATAKGYSSSIETIAGISRDGKMTAIKVVSQNETPGVGNQVADPVFTKRFSQKNIQSLNEVEAITGATVSSKAVIDSVSQKAQEIMGLIKNER